MRFLIGEQRKYKETKLEGKRHQRLLLEALMQKMEKKKTFAMQSLMQKTKKQTSQIAMRRFDIEDEEKKPGVQSSSYKRI